MTASTTDAIAILRIELEYIEPLIWRRVAVRTSMNLKALHKVIRKRCELPRRPGGYGRVLKRVGIQY